MGNLSKTKGAGRACRLGSLLVVILGFASARGAEQAAEKQAGGARLKTMKDHAASIRLTQRDRPVPLREEPIFRYDDTAREIKDSTLWAWGNTGRPAAVLKLEGNPARPSERHWLYGIVSLAPDPITASGAGGWAWSSSGPGVDFHDVPGAPAPADARALRLSQMKAIAARFEVHEFSGPRGRLQLRLLSSPVHRYSDPDARLQDGAIFGFAYGTNPDVLLVVESQQRGAAAPRWRYAVARLGAGKIVVNLDRQEVWSEPGTGIPASKATYMNRFVSIDGES